MMAQARPEIPEAVQGGGIHRAADGTIYAIQYLRAIAALLVVLFHLSASMFRQNDGGVVFAFGAIGVDIFFVLSGLLMAMIMERGSRPGTAFLFRRFARIAPLYYLATLLLFVLAWFVPSLLNTAKADWYHLASSLLFLPYHRANGELTPILTLGWTLNYEFFFYILIALTVRVTGDRSLLSVAGLIIAIAAVGAAVGPVNTFFQFYTDPIIIEFALGILIYRFVFRGSRISADNGISWLALVTGILLVALRHDNTADAWRFLSWGTPAALIVAGGLHAFTGRNEWLRRLGDWSYSIYLLHIYFIQLAVKIIFPAFGADRTPLALAAVVLVPFIVVAAALLYRNVEMPVMHWLIGRCGHFLSRRAPAFPDAGASARNPESAFGKHDAPVQ